MVEIKQKIDPQPTLPIVGFFHSNEEDYDDYDGWCYQHPISDEELPELVYNAVYAFDDPNQPGEVGDLYKGDIIERVRVRVEDDIAYWVVTVRSGGMSSIPTV